MVGDDELGVERESLLENRKRQVVGQENAAVLHFLLVLGIDQDPAVVPRFRQPGQPSGSLSDFLEKGRQSCRTQLHLLPNQAPHSFACCDRLHMKLTEPHGSAWT